MAAGPALRQYPRVRARSLLLLLAVEVEQIDCNREPEGRQESLRARYELAERGRCRRSLVSQE